MSNPNKNPSLLLKNLRRLCKRRHPAILICGDHSVGKNTFLKNAGLHQLEEFASDAKDVQLINTDRAVFVLVEDIASLTEYWLSFQKFISKIIWVIDAPHLLAQQSLLKYTRFFATIKKSISINIVINSTDRLSGFFDFFSHLRPSEIENPVGFSCLRAEFSEKDFLQNFYQPLIKKLHDERNPEKRRLLREFPIQIERCTKHVMKEIQPLRNHSQVDFIFFLSHPAPQSSALPQKPYFTKNVLPMMLSKKNYDLPTGDVNALRWLALPAIPVILSIAVFFIHQAFHINDSALTQAQKIMQNATPQNNFVEQLNQLYLVHQTLEDTLKWPILLGFNQTLSLEKQSGLRYETLLQTEFKGMITDTLKKNISDNLNKNRLDLYNALATYLMLTTKNRLDSKAVTQWFSALWRKEYANDSKSQVQLKAHLQNLLAQIQSPYHQDKALVLEARSFLSTLTPPELAFLRLQNQYSKDVVSPLGENQSLPGVDLSNAMIPVLYDTENFKKIYHTDIPQLVNSINEENWVLGIASKIELNDAEKAGLVEAVQKMYLDNFAQEWAEVLSNVQLTEPKTLSETLRNLNLLTDEQSPFMQLLNAIANNINLSKHPNLEKTKTLTDTITQFTSEGESFQNLFANLKALQKVMSMVAQSKDPKQTSFQLASEYFANPTDNNIDSISKDAANLPAPIKNWVNSVTKSSLTILLENTKSYINMQWQKTIVPFYKSKLDNQFPLFPEATTDVAFADFKAFFGPKGLIDNFFTKFLQPFVDTQSQYWVFKKLNGQGLPIEQNNLNVMIRASLIQEMFFTNSPDKMSFGFYVTPISINPSLRTFSLNIDGQKYAFTPKSHAIVKFEWPISKSSIASITFTPKRSKNDEEDENTPIVLTQNGPWAWFRLLNAEGSSVRPGPTAQVFTLSFTNENKRARFKLVSDNLVNPYLPNIITKFRCPNDL